MDRPQLEPDSSDEPVRPESVEVPRADAEVSDAAGVQPVAAVEPEAVPVEAELPATATVETEPEPALTAAEAGQPAPTFAAGQPAFAPVEAEQPTPTFAAEQPTFTTFEAGPGVTFPDQPATQHIAQLPTSVWAVPEPDPARWAPNPLQFQEPKPKPPPPTCDPLAVALANASFLGAGYLMLRRRLFAVLSILITVALVITLLSLRSIWAEIALVLWWAAMITHGWFLARPGQPLKKQRLIAAALTIPVVLSVGVLRFDAARVENRIDEAKGSGDCGAAVTAVDGLWGVHTIANAPMTARSDATKQACLQLEEAGERLAIALRKGDTDGLKRGYDALQVPAGHEKMADRTRDAFFGLLPSDNPCNTTKVTDWLKANTDRRDVVERVAPKALVECADTRMKADDHQTALQRYQQFLKDFPGHELAPRAQEGEKQAKLAIELANVSSLVRSNRYCDNPAQYSGAPAYGKGVNKSVVLGNDEYAGRLGDWRTAEASEAVLIVCAGKTEMGAPTQTCPYESKPGSGIPVNVTFKKVAIQVRAFELRTGKQVVDTRVEIGGESCPSILQYRQYGTVDLGPPSEVHVKPSDADVRNGFAPVIAP